MYRKLKQRNLQISLGFIISFLAIEIIARVFDFYSKFVEYDTFIHLLFGAALYSIIFLLFNVKSFSTNLIIYIIAALSWELIEKIGDQLITQPTYLLDFFFFDGVLDVLIGIVGTYIAYKVINNE